MPLPTPTLPMTRTGSDYTTNFFSLSHKLPMIITLLVGIWFADGPSSPNYLLKAEQMITLVKKDLICYRLRPVRCTSEFSEKPLEMNFGREKTDQFTALVGIPTVSLQTAPSLKTFKRLRQNKETDL